MKKVLSIGEATLDSFIFLDDANVHCTLDKSKCEFCINYASKTIATDCKFTVGGNAANAAVGFRRLGLESQLFSVRGDDWIGEQIQAVLDEEGVDSRYIQIEPGQTSFATALIFQGERNLVVYHVPRDYHLPKFDPVDWVYLTSMGRAFTHAYERAVTFVKEHNIKMTFNPGTYQLKAGVKALKPILEATEVLVLNTDEARQLTELSVKASFRELAESLYDLGPKVVVITDGQNGAYCFDGRELLFCDIFPSEAVERTGAGDSFATGLSAALLHGKDLSEAMRWGMAESSSVVQKVGPQEGLLTYEQLIEYLDSNRKIQPRVIK
jgi:sugar/nucleoside kinase (ribokinase family)